MFFVGLTSKIPPLGSMLNFDADVKKTTVRHQCEKPLITGAHCWPHDTDSNDLNALHQSFEQTWRLLHVHGRSQFRISKTTRVAPLVCLMCVSHSALRCVGSSVLRRALGTTPTCWYRDRYHACRRRKVNVVIVPPG